MPKYVALLRGIAPMNPNMRNEKLRGVFEDLGYMDVQSLLSSGNIVFTTSETDIPSMEAILEQSWPEKLGFSSTTIIRSLGQLKELQAQEPFKDLSHAAKTSLNVTFLKHPVRPGTPAPAGKSYTLPLIRPQEVCAIVDLTTGKTPDYMAHAERVYGKEITTRTWNTVLRIISKLES